MRNDLNTSYLLGFMGADASRRSNTPNAPVILRIATSERWKDDDGKEQTRTEWHNIAVFDPLDKYALSFKKGDRILVVAKLQENKYPKTVGSETITITTTEIVAVELERVWTKTNAKENTEA